jgi:hypothetical protein
MLAASWTFDWRQHTLSQVEDKLLDNNSVNNEIVEPTRAAARTRGALAPR